MLRRPHCQLAHETHRETAPTQDVLPRIKNQLSARREQVSQQGDLQRHEAFLFTFTMNDLRLPPAQTQARRPMINAMRIIRLSQRPNGHNRQSVMSPTIRGRIYALASSAVGSVHVNDLDARVVGEQFHLPVL